MESQIRRKLKCWLLVYSRSVYKLDGHYSSLINRIMPVTAIRANDALCCTRVRIVFKHRSSKLDRESSISCR